MPPFVSLAGHFVAEIKHVYYSGFRIYLSSSYNIIIFCILSLYIASYTLRIIVYEWVRDADAYVNATKIIENLIRNNESSRVSSIVAEWKATQPGRVSYFIEACESKQCTIFGCNLFTQPYSILPK